MINKLNKRLAELKLLKESIDLCYRVKIHRAAEYYYSHNRHDDKHFTIENMISLYEEGIDSYEYLQELIGGRIGEYPYDWKIDEKGRLLWEEVKKFMDK